MDNEEFNALVNELINPKEKMIHFGDNIPGYIFISNFDIDWLTHIQLCAQLANLDYLINDEAYDIANNLLPNQKSIYMNVNQTDPNAINIFWKLSTALTSFNEKYLIEKGLCDEHYITWGRNAYIGCEKKYFGIEFSDEEKADFLQKLNIFVKEHIDMWG